MKLFVVLMVHPPQEIRHPANAGLGQHDPEVRVGLERAAEDDLTQRFIELHGYCRHERRDLAAARIGHPRAADATTQVKTDRDAGLSRYGPQRLPVFVKHWLDRIEHAEQRALEAELGDPL